MANTPRGSVPDKLGGLGIFQNYERIRGGLNGILNALRNRDRKRIIKDVKNAVKDLKNDLRVNFKDAKILKKRTRDVIRQMEDLLPLIDEKMRKKKRVIDK
jgi:hypothetical protein